VSSFNLQPGRVGRIAILANLVGDKLKQEVLSAATLNSILGTITGASYKFGLVFFTWDFALTRILDDL